MLPENCLGLGCEDARPVRAEELAWVSKAAQQYSVDVCLGLIEDGGGAGKKPSNALFWFSQTDGALKAVYRKLHLFDYGELQESAKIQPGTSLVTTELKGVRVGLSICYDLRFPSMYLRLAREGASIILAPSAFTMATGEAHFRSLVTARALDSQSYIVAPAQAGQHSASRRSWGESMIVGKKRREDFFFPSLIACSKILGAAL